MLVIVCTVIFAGVVYLDSSLSKDYKIKKGDTLSKIASVFRTTVATIKNANNLTSDIIYPYQSLIIPLSFPVTEYVVQKGDTLYSIALRYNSSIDLIRYLNNLGFDTIFPYQTLIVPQK